MILCDDNFFQNLKLNTEYPKFSFYDKPLNSWSTEKVNMHASGKKVFFWEKSKFKYSSEMKLPF